MVGRTRSKVLATLALQLLIGVSAIQNDRTSSKSSQDDIVLSASAYMGPDRTSSVLHRDGSPTFHRTIPAFQLESSKSVHKYDRDDARFEDRHNRHEESIDELTSSKHVDHIDGNNIEVRPGEYYHISPTISEPMSGEGQGAPQGPKLLSEPHQLAGVSNQQAQYLQAIDQQRRARQEIPRIYSEHAPPPILQTASPGHRQANPDIQDIITGIVKLLNGNVNVAANTVRPLRPIQATRINNRGPPRISDVPPLPPDFDTPGMNPPPPPDHPYPFEKPPAPDRPLINQLPPERPIRPFVNGVPLPEQIVPQGNRPWTWNRPGVNRRPISSYKPVQSTLDSTFNREKEQDDKHSDKPQHELKPDHASTEESSMKKEETEQSETTTNTLENVTKRHEENNHQREKTTEKPINENPVKSSESQNSGKKENKHQSPSKENKINNENTSATAETSGSNKISTMQHEDSPKPVIPLEIPIKPTKSLKIGDTQISNPNTSNNEKPNNKPTVSKTPTKSFAASTLNIETSSSVQVIEPTKTKTVVQSTAVPTKNSSTNTTSSTIALEPSKPSNFDSTIVSSIPTPTESLPSSFTKITPTTEKSIVHTTVSNTFSKNSAPTDRYAYRPRPGIVLDDTLDYTGTQGLATQRPYAPPRHPPLGDIFDVTVSAIQGPGGGGSGEGVRVPVNAGNADVILTSAVEGQGFVSIDGKRTYLNLFENSDRTSTHVPPQPQPTRTQQPPAIVGTGFAVAQPDPPAVTPRPSGPIRRPTFHRRPTQPPVRIDTCIVGDTSTCDISQHEACATVQGVSACHCKPGYARLQHSLPCKKIISIVVSIRVDKIYERKVVWDRGFTDKDSEPYQTLSYEANRAIESAMSMTPFSDEYMGSFINRVYQGDVSQGQGGVFVNATLKLTYEPRTIRPSLAGELQRHLLGVIHRRSNNIGNSALYVDSPAGSISNLQDLDECASSELNDCHSSAVCTNNWGGFTCACNPGLKDPHKDDLNESGRTCISCPSTYCNNRGTCSYQGDHMQCSCTGNYYGAQCEVDGEVLGVAIGASVAALIIIVLTLVCLVMWSRRWSREQKSVGSPVYGYIQGGIPGTLPGTLARVGSVGTLASVKQGPPTNLPPYMWAHFGDHMATANVYATEPMGPTRPSSAVFGYPPLSVHGTLPPVPLPRLQPPMRPTRQRHQPDPDSSDSEPQDKDRADLIPQNSGFHVPRPKSRSSLANQSGIYNDVEYDQGDVHHLSKNNIPMSTYRPYYRT
ncbi:63 kDa sperm flagellar membrane protein [Anthophora retusa]